MHIKIKNKFSDGHKRDIVVSQDSRKEVHLIKWKESLKFVLRNEKDFLSINVVTRSHDPGSKYKYKVTYPSSINKYVTFLKGKDCSDPEIIPSDPEELKVQKGHPRWQLQILYKKDVTSDPPEHNVTVGDDPPIPGKGEIR